MTSKASLVGFALLAFGGILALASVGLQEDEPAVFGIVSGGVGLLAVLVGAFSSSNLER